MPFRLFCAALAAGAAALLPAHASADAEKPHTGDVLAVRLIGGLSDFGETDVSNGGTLIDKHSSDHVGAGSVALGYDWSRKGLPFRSELEYAYRYRFDHDLRVFGGTDSDFERDVSSHVVMANVFYDIGTGTRFTPYVGLGVGWARHVAAAEQSKLLGGPKETRDDTTDNLAWSLHAGILYRLGRDWHLEAAYRYVDFGEVSSGPFSDGTTVGTDSYTSHDLVLGILYAF